jgi:hypothetical protein
MPSRIVGFGDLVMTQINPYESPVQVADRRPALSWEKRWKVLVVQIICILYLGFGVIAAIAGVLMSWDSKLATVTPTPGALVFFCIGCLNIVSSFGILTKRAWGVLACQVLSAVYLLGFPIGTILGAYFLINIGEVESEFR